MRSPINISKDAPWWWNGGEKKCTEEALEGL